MIFLKELELINFMCHEYTKIDFSRITSIFGPNGSGKSAILFAINLALGGLGRERQELLRDFIRHGESKAIIRLVLSNTAILPKRSLIQIFEDLPPDAQVVIERIITYDSSFFKLNGRRISKEKLLKRLLKVNLTYKNPFYFVPQEKITKLLDLKPEERVDAFLASMGLLELRDVINKLKKDLKQHLKRKEELQLQIRQLEEKILKEKRALESINVALETLKNYYILKLAAMFKRKEKFERRLEEIKEEIMQVDQDIKQKQEFIESAPKLLEALDKKILALKAQKHDLEQKLRSLDDKIANINKKMSALEEQLRNLGEKSISLTKQIGAILRRWSANNLEDLKSLFEDKKSQLVEIESAIDRSEDTQHIRSLEKLLNQKQEELRELQDLLNKQLSQLNEVLNKLDPSGNLGKIFNFVVKEGLWGEIRGPFALEIKLRLPITSIEQYINALEAAFDRDILQMFLVTSWAALRKLNKFLKKFVGPLPPIIVLGDKNNFWALQQQYNFFFMRSLEELQSEYIQFKEVFDAVLAKAPEHVKSGVISIVSELIFAKEPVKSLLQYLLKDKVIVTNLSIGIELFKSGIINQVITIDGDVVKRSVVNRSAIYFVHPGRNIDLKESIIWLVTTYELYGYREKIRELEDAIAEVSRDIKDLNRQIKMLEEALPRKLKTLWEKRLKLKQTIKEIEHDIKSLERYYQEIEGLPDKRKTLEKEMERVDEELRQLENKRNQLIKASVELGNEIVSLEREKEVLISKRARVLSEIEDLKSKLQQKIAEKGAIMSHINAIDNEINQFKKELKAFLVLIWTKVIKKKFDKDDLLVREIVDPAMKIIKTLTIEQIDNALSRLATDDIEHMRYNLLSREERLKNLEENFAKLDKLRKELEILNSEIENTRDATQKAVKALLDDFKKKISDLDKNYQQILDFVGAKGEIRLRGRSLDALRIEITISLRNSVPREISSGSFSSGEKTLAVFALLLALFLTQPAPILILDEFDVYLDDAMVRKATQLLKKVITNSVGLQCVLTTTHRPEILEISDNIILLEKDRVNNRTLARIIRKDAIKRYLSKGRSR